MPQTELKNGIICLFMPIIIIFVHFGPSLTQFWPMIEPWEQKIAILCKIHNQSLKPCGKMVLVFSLDLLVHFGPFGVYFGPNLTPNSQNWYLKTKIWNLCAKSIFSAWKWPFYLLIGTKLRNSWSFLVINLSVFA